MENFTIRTRFLFIKQQTIIQNRFFTGKNTVLALKSTNNGPDSFFGIGFD